jgi:glutaredoxin
MSQKKITAFLGDTCPHCARILPAIDQLVEQDDVEVEYREVWNNAKNKEEMESLRELYNEHCGGNMIVPSFYDSATHRLICHPQTYDNLRAWLFAHESTESHTEPRAG